MARGVRGRVSRRGVVLLGLIVATAACSPTATGDAEIPESLRALARTTVTLDGRELVVAVADTPEARGRGLMGVADLGPLDGLLFVYTSPIEAAFHMRDVPVPLDIAFIDAGRRVLEILTMPVCDTEPCPTYSSPGAIGWALETEAGGLADVSIGDALGVSQP